MKMFAFLIFIVVLALLVKAILDDGWAYLKSRNGKRMLVGLIGAPMVVLVLGLMGGCASLGYYPGPAKLQAFAGIERTKDISPMCDSGVSDDKLTSNLGVRYTQIVSADGRTSVEAAFRHHSCAIGQDREGYDATGITVARDIYTW